MWKLKKDKAGIKNYKLSLKLSTFESFKSLCFYFRWCLKTLQMFSKLLNFQALSGLTWQNKVHVLIEIFVKYEKN